MNILMITEVFYPVVGGAGKTVYLTASGLVKRGHKVSILARITKGVASRENIDGIEVYRITWLNNFFIQLFSFFNINLFLRRFIKDNPLDLIVFNQPFSAFSACFVKKITDIPNIYTFHSSWFEEFQVKHYIQEIKLNSLLNIFRLIIFAPISFIMRRIEGFVISHCDKISVASEYSKEKLIKFYHINDNKIMIIPGCVDTERFKPAEDKAALRDSLDIPKESYVLITARNLVERMGIDNLIFAFYHLSCLYKDLYLIIAGEGRLKNKLTSLVKEFDISDSVKFTGKLIESELVQYYQASDLFILPTKYIEHFGLVSIEALASGIPVLGTPVGGTVEILNKFNREFIFEGTDAESIARGIKKFLDTSRGVSLKEKCREFAVSQYSFDKIIAQIERAYLENIKK